MTDDTTDKLPAITCSLSETEAKQREQWARENLLPHLDAIEEREDGYSFVFDRNEEAYAAVTEAAWKESQCCAWATFEVELPPGDGPIRWHERSDREAGSEFFGEALKDTLRTFSDAPTPT